VTRPAARWIRVGTWVVDGRHADDTDVLAV
jgi:hypothetical protein